MDRLAFKERLKLYKQAKEQNPLLKYYEFRDIPHYDSGTNYTKSDEYPVWDNTLLKGSIHFDKMLSSLPFDQRKTYHEYLHLIDLYIDSYRAQDQKRNVNPELSKVLEEVPVEGEAVKLRWKYANAYTIPFIPEKEIMFRRGRFNTGRVSENVLDSIYNSAQRTNTPFSDALGLAARESGVGYARGFKLKGYISGTDLYSNWLQIHPIINNVKDTEKYNRISENYNNSIPVSSDDVDFYRQYRENQNKEYRGLRKMTENPIDNALKLFKTGKYNPGDPNHTTMVKADGKLLITDPVVKKWAKKHKVNLEYDKGTGFVGEPDKGTPRSKQAPYMSRNYDETPERFITREPFDSPYEDPRWFADPKPRFELRKGLEIPLRYTPKSTMKFMRGSAKGMGMLGTGIELLQGLFPTEEQEIYENLRYNLDKLNKDLVSHKHNID